MSELPFSLTGSICARATMGLIVLQVDETIEHDFRRLITDPKVALYVSRIESGAELDDNSIATMEGALPRAAGMLPAAARFDVIAYACTSGAALIGADRIAELIRRGATAPHVADPFSAALDALRALEVRSVALISPYVEPVYQPMREAIERQSIEVPVCLSFGERTEARVARVDPLSIRAAALSAGASEECDAVFVSCTNLRTLDIIEDVEAALGKPVLSSNQVLAWQMARMAGGLKLRDGPGRLFSCTEAF